MPKGNPAGYTHKSGFGALGTNPKNIFAPGFRPPRGTTAPRPSPTTRVDEAGRAAAKLGAAGRVNEAGRAITKLGGPQRGQNVDDRKLAERAAQANAAAGMMTTMSPMLQYGAAPGSGFDTIHVVDGRMYDPSGNDLGPAPGAYPGGSNVFAPGWTPQPQADVSMPRTDGVDPTPMPRTDGVDPTLAEPRRPLPPRPYRPPPTGPTNAPGTRTPGTPLGPKFDPKALGDGNPQISAYADSLQFQTPVQIADDLWVNLPVPSAEPSDKDIADALEYASYMESFYEQFLPQFASEAEARRSLGTVSATI